VNQANPRVLAAETIKSSAPFFTVVLTYILLGQRTGWRVNASLVPIVMGLVFCSLSDASFHVIGFVAALMSNCVDCIQNVLTKRLLNRSYTCVQLLRVVTFPSHW
jgi:solute carrier family 35 protein E2